MLPFSKWAPLIHPVPKNYNDADLTYIMNLVHAKAFICPTYFHHTDYEQQAIDAMRECPSVKAIAVCDKFEPARYGTISLSTICVKPHGPLQEKPEVSSDDVVVILSTSGHHGQAQGSPAEP